MRHIKIALIQVTYNDDYKFDQWLSLAKNYLDAFDYHIIVDDCSENNYFSKVQKSFHDAVLLTTGTNGGSTKAYNTGIRYALANTDADFVFLLDNDIKISKVSVHNLVDFMVDNPSVGMAAPIMLEKNSNIVSCHGASISKRLQMRLNDEKKDLSSVEESVVYCEAVQGGVNVASRCFYETVGLQDEKLYMYSDEVDLGIRAKKAGFKMVSIRESVCWHQHINPDNTEFRKPFSNYLMARNKVYIAKKNKMHLTALRVFFYYFKLALKYFFVGLFKNKRYLTMSKYTMNGLLNGMFGNMKINKYCKM